MKVVKERDGGIVRKVWLLDDESEPVAPACRFLSHLGDREFSPNTLSGYGYFAEPRRFATCRIGAQGSIRGWIACDLHISHLGRRGRRVVNCQAGRERQDIAGG